MKLHYLFPIAVSLILTTACSNEDFIEPTTPDNEEIISRNAYEPINLTTSEADLINKQSVAAISFFKEMCDSGYNVAFSPLSAFNMLSIVANGADEEVRKALLKIITGNEDVDIDVLNATNQKLKSELIKADNTSTMVIANSIWSDYNLGVKTPFMDTAKKYYDVENFEFDTNETNNSTINKMNAWVSEKTDGMITGITGLNVRLIYLYLINTNLFKSTWANKDFAPENTKEEIFTNAYASPSIINMMNDNSHPVGYLDCTDYEIGDIEYGNGAHSLSIIMPKEGADFNEFIASIDPKTLLSQIKKVKSTSYNVDLKFPKFELKNMANFDITLDKLGLNSLQLSNLNNSKHLTGISDFDKLNLSEILHQTALKFEEKGVVAAAVTNNMPIISPGPDIVITSPTEFHVNRAFMFVISERSTGSILYMGKVEKL